MQKGIYSNIQMDFNYTEEAKANDKNLRDSSTAMYYIKTNDDSYNDLICVNYTDKVFWVYESGILGKTMIYSMYPSSIDSYMIIPTDVPLISQIRYSLGLIPFLFSTNYSTVDDNGRKAFVVEEYKTFFSSDDSEYTKMKTYYDNDTMLAYKRTMVKKDGTEKLYAEYEVTLNSLTDEDVAIPDLAGYSQILMNN